MIMIIKCNYQVSLCAEKLPLSLLLRPRDAGGKVRSGVSGYSAGQLR